MMGATQYGSLDSLFGGVTTPHYYAAGGRRKGPSLGQQGYTFPIPKNVPWSSARTDMGWDLETGAAGVGKPILAIGRSRILRIQSMGAFGPTWMSYKLLDGPDANRNVFTGRSGPPRARVGQIVQRGQPYVSIHGGSYGGPPGHMEIGWANADGSNTAAASHYSEGQVTAEGTSFKRFLQGLPHSMAGMGGGVAPTLKMPKIGGAGPLATIARAAIRKIGGAAQSKVNSVAGAMGGGAMPGGGVPGHTGRLWSDLKQYDRTYPMHLTGTPGYAMPRSAVRRLFDWGGLPPEGFTYDAQLESGYMPGIQQRDPGDGMVGYGLLQPTPHSWGGGPFLAMMNRLGGIPACSTRSRTRSSRRSCTAPRASGRGRTRAPRTTGRDVASRAARLCPAAPGAGSPGGCGGSRLAAASAVAPGGLVGLDPRTSQGARRPAR